VSGSTWSKSRTNPIRSVGGLDRRRSLRITGLILAHHVTAPIVAHGPQTGGGAALSRVRRNFYVGPPLLIVDELGYIPLDRSAATWRPSEVIAA